MQMNQDMLRGRALVDAVIAHVTDPASRVHVASPQPLDAGEIAALEAKAGVTLPPSFRAWLAFDVSLLSSRYGWELDGGLPVKPVTEVVGTHAGVFLESFQPVLDKFLPGMALQLDAGSDSMRFLYFGSADPDGELPVLFIDHDDTPIIGVEWPGFDVWLAVETGLLSSKSSAYARLSSEVSRRVFGSPDAIDTTDLMIEAMSIDM